MLMKKSVSLFFIFCVTIGFVLFRYIGITYACEACDAKFASINLGDINDDGNVNAIDFAFMRLYLLGEISLSKGDKGLVIADINQDGYVNSLDFAKFRKILLGKETMPPVPTPTPKPKVIIESDFEFDLDTGTIIKYVGEYSTLTIPSVIRGENVKVIGEEAFSGCLDIESITISEGTTYIGSKAFYGCENLISVTLPDSINRIDSSAFEECKELREVIFIGNQPEHFGSNVFVNVHLDFKIIISLNSLGFDKPIPYNNETSWGWSINSNPEYNVTPAQEEIVVFRDEYLRLVVLKNNGKNEYDIIYKSDVDKITRLLLLKSIDLSELTKFTNIDTLEIVLSNDFIDISPISNLTNLTKLGLYDIELRDISPLKDLTNLEYLEFVNNNISDILPLENLAGLEYLYLSHNNISDISPLKKLTKLTSLDLSNNNISDISPLENLTGITNLYLTGNNISDFSPILHHPNLEFYKY